MPMDLYRSGDHYVVLTVSIPVAQKAKPRRIQVAAPADQTVIEASPQHRTDRR